MKVDTQADREKLEKYLLKFTQDMVRSTRSVYFRFDGYIVRVSDHIGTNSSGNFSIIPMGHGSFVIHKHSNGNLKLQNYEQVKEFVRHIAEYSDFVNPVAINQWEIAKGEAVIKPGADKESVLGVSKKLFSPAQINAIMSLVNQVKVKNKIP